MKKYYAQILNDLDLERVLTITSDNLEQRLKETIVKIIFYSSNMEGNQLNRDYAELLLDGGFINRNGKLEDYIELINHSNAYKKLVEISKKSIDVNDVVSLRSELLKNIPQPWKGLRRDRTRAENYITDTADLVRPTLETLLQMINKEPQSRINALLNAIEFHLRFVHIHPFEDGNGRTVRLLMNLYLMKSNLRPLLILKDDYNKFKNLGMRGVYGKSIVPYHYALYEGGFISTVLFYYLTEEETKILLKKLENGNADDLGIVELKALFSNLYYATVTDSLLSDVNKLYKTDAVGYDSKLAALYLLYLNRIDENDIISPALKSQSDEVRAMAILAASANIRRYKEILYEIAMRDTLSSNRALAVDTLGYAGLLTEELFKHILYKETNNAVLSTFLSATLIDMYGDFYGYKKRAEIYEKFKMTDDNYIRTSIARLQVKWGDEECLLKNISIEHENEVLMESVILMLGFYDTFDSSVFNIKPLSLQNEKIAEKLVNFTKNNKQLLDVLLGTLANAMQRQNILSKSYNLLLGEIITGDKYNVEEKAYAIYIKGSKECDILNNAKYTHIDKDNPSLINIALFLAGFDNSIVPSEKLELFNIKENNLLTVQSVEFNKVLNQMNFSNDFLELYSKDFKHWN